MSLCEKGLILERWKTSQALGFCVSALPGCSAPCWAAAVLLSPAFILGCSMVPQGLQCQPGTLQSKLPCQQLKSPDCALPAISHLRQSLQATREEEKVHAVFSRWVKRKVSGGGEEICVQVEELAGPTAQKHSRYQVLLCQESDGSQKASRAFSFRIFFSLYNHFLLQQSLRINLKINLILHL